MGVYDTMRFSNRISLVAILTIALWLSAVRAGEPKLAQTGFQFLSVPTQARAAAMGDAFTAMYGGSMSIFYNPAAMAFSPARLDLSLSQNNWIGDIKHVAGSLSFTPANGHYGTFGISILSVDYGEFFGTVVDPTSESGYLDTGTFSPSAFAVGLAYSKALTDRFSFGIHVKHASEDLGSVMVSESGSQAGAHKKSYSEGVIAFDFGTIYRTGFKSLAFAMSVQNFSREVRFESEGFQLPLVFNIGVSMDMMEVIKPGSERHSFVLAVDAIHPRAGREQIKIGGEYMFMKVLALRAGYHHNVDERDVSVGAGLQLEYGGRGGRIALDYAYTPFGIFDNVQRFTFKFSL
jgi:hypothetical protein